MRTTTTVFGQDGRYQGRDLNPGAPAYEAGMLTTQPRFVKMCHFIFSVAYGTKMKYTRHRAITLMMEAVSTSETSVDNYFTRQYIPGDNSELERMM
jgi:hypothetical protein